MQALLATAMILADGQQPKTQLRKYHDAGWWRVLRRETKRDQVCGGVWVCNFHKMIRWLHRQRTFGQRPPGRSHEHHKGTLRKWSWPGSLLSGLQGPGGQGGWGEMSGRAWRWGQRSGAREVAKGKIRWGLLECRGDLGFNSKHEGKPSEGSEQDMMECDSPFKRLPCEGGRSEAWREGPCGLHTRSKQQFNSFIDIPLIFLKLHILNVYNLVSLNIHIHAWNHHPIQVING